MLQRAGSGYLRREKMENESLSFEMKSTFKLGINEVDLLLAYGMLVSQI